MEITDPIKTLSDDLRSAGIRPNRKKGQNYLISPKARNRIVDLADISPDDCILEIGPGTGILTWALARNAGRLISVENETSMASLLQERFSGYRNVSIVRDDGLKVMQRLADADADKTLKIVSNLPYGITSPVLLLMCAHPSVYPRGILLLQKEVVDRVVAGPGDSQRSALSVLVQSRFTVKRAFQVKATAFRPQPRVDSAMLTMACSDKLSTVTWDTFSKVVFQCFGQRRKTILNNLKASWSVETAETAMDRLGLIPTLRPQDLELEAFLSIAEYWNEMVGTE